MKRAHKRGKILLVFIVILCTACQVRPVSPPMSTDIPETSEQVTQTISNASTSEVSTQIQTQTSSLSTNRVTIDSRIRGNDYINSVHRGYFVEYLGWYYISSEEDRALYKMRPDGSEKTLVTQEYIGDFNIVRDWFYYTGSGHVWKMRLDGTDKSPVYKGRTDQCIVLDDYLFFVALEDVENNAYRMKLDGSEKQLLARNINHYSFFDGDYFYFLDMSDWRTLYRIHIAGDGSDKEPVYRHSSIIEREFMVRGNQLFAIASDGIWHIDLETKKGIQLTASDGFNINIDDEWLYYEDQAAGMDAEGEPMGFSGSFYKVRFDGSEKQMLSHLWPNWMYIPSGDWIYFLNVDKEEADPDVSVSYLAKIRKDGTGFQRLFEYKE